MGYGYSHKVLQKADKTKCADKERFKVTTKIEKSKELKPRSKLPYEPEAYFYTTGEKEAIESFKDDRSMKDINDLKKKFLPMLDVNYTGVSPGKTVFLAY